MKPFIVEFWSKIFYALGRVSPFLAVRCLVNKKFPAARESYGFVEGWVLGHLILAILLLLICSAPNLHWWEIIAISYGGVRVFEVVIYQSNVLLFDEYRAKKAGKPYAVRGFRRLVVLLLHNYAEIIFWFALFYRNLDWAFKTNGANLNTFSESLKFSFAKMTTFASTTIYPQEARGDVVTLIQSVIGLFMVLLILARFISLIPKPETLDEFEK